MSRVRVLLVLAAGCVSPGGAFAVCPSGFSLLGTTDYGGAAGFTDVAEGVAVDGSGNVVVVGYEWGTSGASNWRVRKYDSTLSTLLASTDYNGPGNDDDYAWSGAVDGSGNILVAGQEWSATGGFNWRVRKYDSTLTTLLSTTDYNGPGNGYDNALGVALDGSGNVLVAGIEEGTTGSSNWRVRKYDSTLTTLLASTDYNGPGNGGDAALGVVVDGSGNVVVAGYEGGVPAASAHNWRVRKYDPTLTTLLSTTDYDGGNGYDDALAVALDGSGNVLVVGNEETAAFTTDWRVRKYDSTLSTLLASTAYDGPGNNNDTASGVAPDGSGNVVVAGTEAGSAGGNNWRLRKYDPTLAVLLSTTDYDGPASGIDYVSGMRADGSGNVVAVGMETGTTGGYNWRVRKYRTTAGPGAVGALAFSPPAVSAGQVGTVVMTVTDTACGPLTNVAPALSILPGGPAAVLLSGPVPMSASLLGDGGKATFTWTWSAGGAGVVRFTATASGFDTGSSSTVYANAVGSVPVQAPPVAGGGFNPLELNGPGAATDRNALEPERGETVLVRIRPVNDDPVVVRIFTASGRLVRTLRGRTAVSPTLSLVTWDGKTEDELPVARGVYLVEVTGGGIKALLKVVVK